MTTDYTRDEDTILVNLIREKNPNQVLTTSLVTFGFPNVHTPTPQEDRNTVIVGTSVPGRRYTGSHAFYYNRQPLSAFVNPHLDDQTTFIIDGERSLVALLPRINERYNINLTADRIEDRAIPDLQAGGIDELQVPLTVTSSSRVFLGSITLILKPELIPLASVIKIKRGAGLTYTPNPM